MIQPVQSKAVERQSSNNNLCNSMLNFTQNCPVPTLNSAGKENNDPSVGFATSEYNINSKNQKNKSQVRKVGDQIIMSSAYSSAS